MPRLGCADRTMNRTTADTPGYDEGPASEDHASDLGLWGGADDGNRTRVFSLGIGATGRDTFGATLHSTELCQCFVYALSCSSIDDNMTPSSANDFAIANPMPAVDPVTSASFSLSCKSMLLGCNHRADADQL